LYREKKLRAVQLLEIGRDVHYDYTTNDVGQGGKWLVRVGEIHIME
jgi:hypothetical protein